MVKKKKGGGDRVRIVSISKPRLGLEKECVTRAGARKICQHQEGSTSFTEVTGNGGLGSVEDKRSSESAQSTGPDVHIGERKNLVA